MRKKSHILLGRYLADQMSEVYSLQQHRKAFCLGNIMPDLKPSFLTTRHEFFGTFDHLQNKMRALVEKNPEEENARVYWRNNLYRWRKLTYNVPNDMMRCNYSVTVKAEGGWTDMVQ